MKKNVLASMALAASMISPAFAADIPRRAPPPMPAPAPVSTWTGCYIGINGGWVQAETRLSISGLGDDFSRSKSGGAFGGQIGCDYQFAPNWVFGIQGMLDGTNLDGDHVSVRFANTRFHAELDGFATITGRVGYLFTPAFMVYGKFGWGTYRTDLSAHNTLTGVQLGSASKTHSGLDLGVGGEWMFSPNWSLWVEWDRIFPQDKTHFFPNLAGGTTTTVRRDLDKVLVGINLRFGGFGGGARAY